VRRPIRRNLALAGNLKIELVAKLLSGQGHDLEVLSQGEVVDYSLDYFPAFEETTRFDASIPVYYASSLPWRYANGWWSANRLRRLLELRHRRSAFDLVVVYNLKQPQVACAVYSMEHLALPVVLEFEDDLFVDVHGKDSRRLRDVNHWRRARKVLDRVSGCVAVSPHLLSRLPSEVPSLLVRGIVGEDLVSGPGVAEAPKKNRVLYSGTFAENKGLVQLIEAWRIAGLSGWELHIAGDGIMRDRLSQLASSSAGIVFHGLLSRGDLVQLLSTARIGINPHDVSATPGNVFAFKIVEYLAAGAHVISTRMGPVESELEQGVTYLSDNRPETIAQTLRRVVLSGAYQNCADRAALHLYGAKAVGLALDGLLRRATLRFEV